MLTTEIFKSFKNEIRTDLSNERSPLIKNPCVLHLMILTDSINRS